jgi:hypothetical protein
MLRRRTCRPFYSTRGWCAVMMFLVTGAVIHLTGQDNHLGHSSSRERAKSRDYWVSLSTNLDQAFLYFAPFSVYFWKQCHWRPHLFITAPSHHLSGQSQIVLELLNELRADVSFLSPFWKGTNDSGFLGILEDSVRHQISAKQTMLF